MAHQQDDDQQDDEQPESDEIMHLPLEGLFPAGHTFALNRPLCTLLHLAIRQGHTRVLSEQHFTTTELSVLLPILEQYPHHCPYEVLVARFNGASSEHAIARARTRLQEAGLWDEEMRPIRSMLSRARLKLHDMGLDLVSLFETGYLLTRHSRRRLRRKTDESGERRDAADHPSPLNRDA